MNFKSYQEESGKTLQEYKTSGNDKIYLGFLGLAGEAGSVLTTLKKLIRDGSSFDSFSEKLKEELGDVLWYISAIATHYDLCMEEVARENLIKTFDRFKEAELINLERFDTDYEERFPDSFTVNFIQEVICEFTQVRMIWEDAPIDKDRSLGDPLTDNSKIPNQYRFHDVFHLGHVAFLGWSPVLRWIFR